MEYPAGRVARLGSIAAQAPTLGAGAGSIRTRAPPTIVIAPTNDAQTIDDRRRGRLPPNWLVEGIATQHYSEKLVKHHLSYRQKIHFTFSFAKSICESSYALIGIHRHPS